jgi:hypothetical protein
MGQRCSIGSLKGLCAANPSADVCITVLDKLYVRICWYIKPVVWGNPSRVSSVCYGILGYIVLGSLDMHMEKEWDVAPESHW